MIGRTNSMTSRGGENLPFLYTGEFTYVWNETLSCWTVRFMTGGTLTPSADVEADIVLVGGGSGGASGAVVYSSSSRGAGGNGGDGGKVSSVLGAVLSAGTDYAISIGASGAESSFGAYSSASGAAKSGGAGSNGYNSAAASGESGIHPFGDSTIGVVGSSGGGGGGYTGSSWSSAYGTGAQGGTGGGAGGNGGYDGSSGASGQNASGIGCGGGGGGGNGGTGGTGSAGAVFVRLVLPPVGTPLESCTWRQINAIGAADSARTYFSVGDEKTVVLSTGEVVTVEIADFDHDVLSSDGTTRTAMTFVLKNCMNDKAYMNPTNTNVGGWASCALRTTLQSTIYNTLPEGLRDVIKTVRKLTSEGNQSTSVGVTADTLFLFSEIELSGASRYSADGEGSRYAVFTTNESRVKNVDGVATGWFTRSAIEDLETAFVIASSQGNISNTPNYYARGVCFGFCV